MCEKAETERKRENCKVNESDKIYEMNEAEKNCREYLADCGMADRIIDFKNSDITAESTALALDVDVDRICKGLAFKGKGGNAVVVIASGKARVNNGKFKDVFGFRPSMRKIIQAAKLGRCDDIAGNTEFR